MLKRLIVIGLLLTALASSGCWLFFKPKTETPPPPKALDQAGLSEQKRALYSEDPEYRALAANALIERGDKRAMQTLSDALRTAKDEVVVSILKVLTRRPEIRLIEPLIDILETRNPALQPLIFEVIKYYDRPVLIPDLLERLRHKNKTIEAKNNVVKALGKATSKDEVEPLINYFGTHDGKLDEEINKTLEQITLQRYKTKEEWQEWWSVYKDKPREVWLDEAVIKYQKLIAEKDAKIDKIMTELVGIKINQLNIRLEQARKGPTQDVLAILFGALTDSLWQVKKYAVEQFKTVPQESFKDVLPKLAEMINAPEDELRTTVITMLGELGGENELPALVKILENPKEKDAMRIIAANALGRLANQKATAPLTGQLKGNSQALILAVIEALGKIKDGSAVPALVICLEDKAKTDDVHRDVIESLGEIKTPYAVEVIIQYASDIRDRIRWTVASNLGKVMTNTAIAPLSKLLEDQFDDIRQTSAESMGNLGMEEGAQYLIKALFNDKDPRVRELSAVALGKIKSALSLSSIIPALSDANEKVANAAWNTIVITINSDVKLLADIAGQLAGAKHLSRAAELYKKAVETSNEEAHVKALLEIYKELKQVDGTAKMYANLIARQVKNSSPWRDLKVELVNFLYENKEYAKVLEEVKEPLADPNIPQNTAEQLQKLKTESEKALKDAKPPE
ncbi:MAG: HEAT repeat domain-containing protein [Planctomycetes bacterium]|nr:HEAT repeat domain-containing protein [Planctomycetota bacterium]